MEFKKIIFLFILIPILSTSFAQSENEDAVLQLRYDIFEEVNFYTEYDMGSFLNNSFLTNYYRGGFINNEIKNTNVQRLRNEKNPFGNSFITKIQYRQLPETLFNKHNIGFSFTLQQNNYQEFQFTQDAFQLIFYGNKMYSGKNANLSEMNLKYLNFTQIKAGLFWQNREKFIEYGFQFAFNMGNQYQNFESHNAQLYTDTLGRNIQLNGEFKNLQTSYLGNNFSKIQGLGAAIDFYFQKYKIYKYTIRVDINNLGFIHWNKNTINYNKSETINYEGVEISNIFQIPQPLISTSLTDTINDYLMTNSTVGSNTSYTPTTVNVYTLYYLNNKISASTLLSYRFFSIYKPFYQLGIQYHFNKRTQIGTNANYGGYTKFNIGIDFQTKINHNFVLKIQTKYLSGILQNKFSGLGAYLEINYKF